VAKEQNRSHNVADDLGEVSRDGDDVRARLALGDAAIERLSVLEMGIADELVEAHEQIARLEERLEAAEGAVREIHASTSWRMAGGVRALGRLVRRRA
jgi:chromosome segregation ATPase